MQNTFGKFGFGLKGGITCLGFHTPSFSRLISQTKTTARMVPTSHRNKRVSYITAIAMAPRTFVNHTGKRVLLEAHDELTEAELHDSQNYWYVDN